MQPNLTYLNSQPPLWLALFFGLTTTTLVAVLYAGLRRSHPKSATALLVGIVLWLLFLGVLSGRGFFLNIDASVPRFLLAILPPVAIGLGALLMPTGQRFYDAIPLSFLTVLHTIRFPVELTLYGLCVTGQVPELMTFEGRNPDILIGLTAPVVAYGLLYRNLSLKWVFLWNVVGLAFLLNIVVNAVLAAPLPFQQWGFDQPNVGVLKFPFVWLPGFIVPLVLVSHIAAMRQLLRRTSVA